MVLCEHLLSRHRGDFLALALIYVSQTAVGNCWDVGRTQWHCHLHTELRQMCHQRRWARAELPQHLFFLCLINDERNCCYASVIIFIMSALLGKLDFQLYGHCQNTLWSEGRVKELLRAEKKQVLIEQLIISSLLGCSCFLQNPRSERDYLRGCREWQ